MKWNKIEDFSIRSPNIGKEVMVTLKDGSILESVYDGDKFIPLNTFKTLDDNILAWAKKPKPFKNKNSLQLERWVFLVIFVAIILTLIYAVSFVNLLPIVKVSFVVYIIWYYEMIKKMINQIKQNKTNIL